MAEQAPTVRVDRDQWNETYLYVVEQVLYRLADSINALTARGAIYSQIALPPDEAARKRALMGQGGQ